MDPKLIDKLSKEQEDLVLADVGYTREQLKADVKQIREWLEQQHHLPPSRLKENDSFLEHYLTGCKGSLEKVKKKLDFYFTCRSYSELYELRDPMVPEYLAVDSICECALLPHGTIQGSRLVIGTFVDKDPQKFDFLSFCKMIINRTEVYLRLAGYSTKNYIMFNCKGASPTLALKMKPSIIRDMVALLEEGLPFRFIKIAFINAPSYIEIAANSIIKPFLSKKLKERFYVTSDGPDDLLNYYSTSTLPSDYGGDSTNPSLKDYSEMWTKNELANRQWFLNDLSERNDESKRTNMDNISKNPYFGVYGSLKNLVID